MKIKMILAPVQYQARMCNIETFTDKILHFWGFLPVLRHPKWKRKNSCINTNEYNNINYTSININL
jgi:hypothetical protein